MFRRALNTLLIINVLLERHEYIIMPDAGIYWKTNLSKPLVFTTVELSLFSLYWEVLPLS